MRICLVGQSECQGSDMANLLSESREIEGKEITEQNLGAQVHYEYA
jgi:hypothetical protein